MSGGTRRRAHRRRGRTGRARDDHHETTIPRRGSTKYAASRSFRGHYLYREEGVPSKKKSPVPLAVVTPSFPRLLPRRPGCRTPRRRAPGRPSVRERPGPGPGPRRPPRRRRRTKTTSSPEETPSRTAPTREEAPTKAPKKDPPRRLPRPPPRPRACGNPNGLPRERAPPRSRRRRRVRSGPFRRDRSARRDSKRSPRRSPTNLGSPTNRRDRRERPPDAAPTTPRSRSQVLRHPGGVVSRSRSRSRTASPPPRGDARPARTRRGARRRPRARTEASRARP